MNVNALAEKHLGMTSVTIIRGRFEHRMVIRMRSSDPSTFDIAYRFKMSWRRAKSAFKRLEAAAKTMPTYHSPAGTVRRYALDPAPGTVAVSVDREVLVATGNPVFCIEDVA